LVDSIVDRTEAAVVGLSSLVVALEGVGEALVLVAVNELSDLGQSEHVVVDEVELGSHSLEFLFIGFLLLFDQVIDMIDLLGLPVVCATKGIILPLLHDSFGDIVDFRFVSINDLALNPDFILDCVLMVDQAGLSIFVEFLGVLVGVGGVHTLGVELALQLDDVGLFKKRY